MRQEALIPQVDLTESEMDEIASQIEAFRNIDGGDADIDKLMQNNYQAVLDLEKQVAKNKQDADLAKQLAFARENYDFFKSEVKGSVEKQKGAVKKPVADEDSFKVVTYTRTMLDLHEDEKKAIQAEIESLRADGE